MTTLSSRSRPALCARRSRSNGSTFTGPLSSSWSWPCECPARASRRTSAAPPPRTFHRCLAAVVRQGPVPGADVELEAQRLEHALRAPRVAASAARGVGAVRRRSRRALAREHARTEQLGRQIRRADLDVAGVVRCAPGMDGLLLSAPAGGGAGPAAAPRRWPRRADAEEGMGGRETPRGGFRIPPVNSAKKLGISPIVLRAHARILRLRDI